MFHEVTDEPHSSGFQRPGALPYKHTPRQFAAYLRAFGDGQLVPSLVTTLDLERPGRHLLLTFDDGGRSAVFASEALANLGWKGHFFIVTSLIGQPAFVTPDDIRTIRGCGHVIGAHSHTHPSIFKGQPFDTMVEEWRISRDILAQLLGEACLTASVPGGDLSPAVLASADAAGLRYLFTSEPWLVPRKAGGCWALGRFSVKANTSARRVGALAQFRGWRRAQATRRMRVLATDMLPSLYRLYVRRRTQPSP